MSLNNGLKGRKIDMFTDIYDYNKEKLEYAYEDGLINITTIVESEYIGGLKVIIDEVDYIE